MASAVLLPTSTHRLGPVSRRLLVRRLVLPLGAMFVVGCALVIASSDRIVRTLGVSLVFPGAGLLYEGSPALFVLTLAAMVLAVILWWGLGAWWGLPLVWWGAAVLALLIGDRSLSFVVADGPWDWVLVAAPLAALAVVATAVTRFERAYRRKRAQVPGLNDYLASSATPTPSLPLRQPDEMDARLLEWALRMALQPDDEFRGFDWGEQIHGPTCVRYQLNMLGYALALFSANYVPNGPGTVERAMAKLIEKQTDLRVWSYWPLINRIGNLDWNPDPIVRDNIMLSAYVADQINLYEAATGSSRFDEPGSLTFVWKDGRVFPYDHHTIVDAVARNFAANDLGLFPCEPGWVFSFCNVMGGQAIHGHDTLHGTALWKGVEAHWRRGIVEEMLTPDGHLSHIRSKVFGVSFDTGEVPGGEYYLAGTNRLVDIAPDLAERGTKLALRAAPSLVEHLRGQLVDGELHHDIAPRLERNTLIKTSVLDWSGLIATCRALGDEELAVAAQRRMEVTCATGESWPERPLAAGAQTIGVALMTRWSTPLSTSGLAQRGYLAPTGPVLVSDPWPSALVLEARSPDARSLELKVKPMVDDDAELVLSFARLVPAADYEFTGPGLALRLVADDRGGAEVTLRLRDAGELLLRPIG